jgi:hypothetical protein
MNCFEHTEATQISDAQASSVSAAHHEVQATQKTALLDRNAKADNKAEPTHLDMTDPFAKKDGGDTAPFKSKLQSGDGTAADISGMANGKTGGDTNPTKGKNAGCEIVVDFPSSDIPVKAGPGDTTVNPSSHLGDTGKEMHGADKNGPPENVGANKQNGGEVGSGNKSSGPNRGDGGISPDSAQKAKEANVAQQADAPVRKGK